MRNRLGLALLVVLVFEWGWLALGARIAQAQAEPAPDVQASEQLPNGYREAVELGFKEFELGNYAEARTRFRAAEALLPNARVFRAVGMVEYELRNYVSAIDYLQRALSSSVRSLAPEDRAETQQLLGRARAYVARYTIVTRPADAKLTLNSEPLTLSPDHTVMLQVGEHWLEAQAPQHHPARRALHVVGQADQLIDLALTPIAPPTHTEAPRDTPLYQSPWLWVGIGVAVVGAGVALGFALQPGTRTEVGAPIATSHTPPGVSLQALGSR